MERWGAFSVIDHKNEVALATELLLYDKIAVPWPIASDWDRWQKEGWEPARLQAIHDRLQPAGLMMKVEWNAERQKNWQEAFDEAKADICRVNDEVRADTDKRVGEAAGQAYASEELRRQAIESAAWAMTRSEIVRHLGEQPVAMFNGVVEFYAAYQSRSDFEAHHKMDDLQRGVERVNFLVQHRMSIPDEPGDVLLDRVIRTATDQTFRERRRLFYDWQTDLLVHQRTPETIVRELNLLVGDFERQAASHGGKMRQELVVTVLTVAGAALGAAAGAGWLGPGLIKAAAAVAGGANAVGLAVWRSRLGRREIDAPSRVAAPGAMFHQIERDVGFEFLKHAGPKLSIIT